MTDETDDGQDKTEDPTPKRMQDALEKGQVLRSRELATFAVLVVASVGILALGPGLIEDLSTQMRLGLALDAKKITDTAQIQIAIGQMFVDMILILAPFLGLMLVVALAAPLALGGWTFSLSFHWDKLDPIAGMGRIFSSQALMELLKALAKFAIVAVVAVWMLWKYQAELLHLGHEPLLPALHHTATVLGWIFLVLSLPMIVVAGIDVPFQIITYFKQLRMTKQEVRDEMKDNEGKPEVKARIRRMQQEMAQKRMMDQVPSAHLLVNNPSHYTVALRYEAETMSAPAVVALGVDHIALQIREHAKPHRIPQVVSPLLARALYYNCQLNKPIPNILYSAVAQILAHIYRLRRDDALEDKPIIMDDIPVPPSLRTE